MKYYRKWIMKIACCLLAALWVGLLPPGTALAATESELANPLVMPNKILIALYVGSTTVSVNGTEMTIPGGASAAPFTERDQVYLPLVLIPGFTDTEQISALPVKTVENTKYVSLTAMAKATGLRAYYDRGLIALGSANKISALRRDKNNRDTLISRLNALPTVGNIEKLSELAEETDFGGMSHQLMISPSVMAEASVSEAADNAVSYSTAPAGALAPTVPPSAATQEATASSAIENYSTTNIQVAGVDEGDIIKTDGQYIYYLNRSQLTVVKALPADQMQIESTLLFDDPYFTPHEIYVSGNTLSVIGSTVRAQNIRQNIRRYPNESQEYRRTMTRTCLYDITDKSNVTQVREVVSEGEYLSSRRIGEALYVVSSQPLYSLRHADTFAPPEYYDSADHVTYRPIDYDRIFYFPHVYEARYLSIAGIRLDDNDTPASVNMYFGAGTDVYVSTEHLYVTAPDYRSTPSTRIYKFSLSKGQVTFLYRGQVPGTALNQFSMDEYEGFFRIATTGYGPQYENTNNLYVLNDTLSVTGRIENIAPGERIYSTRFMGRKGYMVTFKNVDPLFAFDLSDPYAPRLMGALKIPGYSDYLHPYDENHLIGFGKDTVEYNGTAFYQGMKISLFDISDIENPLEMYTEIIGGRGTESELLYNHRALLFDRSRQLLAFPVTIREVPSDRDTGPTDYGAFVSQGARVYQVDLTNGFRLRGDITHLDREDSLKAGYYNGDYDKYVQRILYIGDTLYTVSDAILMANRIDGLQPLGSIPLR